VLAVMKRSFAPLHENQIPADSYEITDSE